MPRLIKGWERGSVDVQAVFDADAPEAWQAWADSVEDRLPEATLCQLLALSVRGGFEGPEEGEGDDRCDD